MQGMRRISATWIAGERGIGGAPARSVRPEVACQPHLSSSDRQAERRLRVGGDGKEGEGPLPRADARGYSRRAGSRPLRGSRQRRTRPHRRIALWSWNEYCGHEGPGRRRDGPGGRMQKMPRSPNGAAAIGQATRERHGLRPVLRTGRGGLETQIMQVPGRRRFTSPHPPSPPLGVSSSRLYSAKRPAETGGGGRTAVLRPFPTREWRNAAPVCSCIM